MEPLLPTHPHTLNTLHSPPHPTSAPAQAQLEALGVMVVGVVVGVDVVVGVRVAMVVFSPESVKLLKCQRALYAVDLREVIYGEHSHYIHQR